MTLSMSTISQSRPIITLNNDPASLDHPLTTEEPIDHPELVQELADINEIRDKDAQVQTAIIEQKTEPNKLPSFADSEDERTPIEEKDLDDLFARTHKEENEEDEDEEAMDEQLYRTTEANRHIAYDEQSAPRPRSKSLRSKSISTRRSLLVFQDQPVIVTKPDRIVTTYIYGSGAEGELDLAVRPTRRRRSYMVACDFSEESFYAMEWLMGTILRDGDEIHVVTAVNREDNPEVVKAAGWSLAKELKKASEAVTEEAKKTLGQMLLFDVKLVTHAISGRVKDVLATLIQELPLTMVVCGSRGRGTVKGLLMGSISTFLVHKSTVPVSVIRPQKKKKKSKKKMAEAPSLTESVTSGQLAVDEVEQKT
ncbi:uncharacterized protein BYT42DRAFT_648977 [Radiomyces spectabilis]|uniref:uncharacterized protein n=1 Tax=Radiomyces spectabilis TaxID=64574 RepID=UPI0022208C95|nr:uncharacterized protein BYT42DRAFT_648977 [Radiomyces spectabilis]KAI8365968.1 hypothetical protein BYT42DRAFT_648977 [Radiomyces spectabilis]